MASVLGLGDNTIDVYLDEALGFPGGNAVNVSVFCSRLGARSAYLGAVGHDIHGERLLASLARESVDVSRCQIVKGNNAWACVESNHGDRRFLGSDAGVCKRLELSPAIQTYISQFDAVHTSTYSGLDQRLPTLHGACKKLSYDLSDDWTDRQLHDVCPYVDILFISASDQSELECQLLAQRCLDLGAHQVVMTRAGQGSMAFTTEISAKQPAVETTVVDTMAAGDGFIAAYLMATLAVKTLDQCLSEGAVYAAQVCREEGGFGHRFSISPEFHERLTKEFRGEKSI